MEENNLAQETNIMSKDESLKSKKQTENQGSAKQMNNKTKLWLIIVGAIVGTVAISGIVVGVLAANGVFDNSSANDDSCPADKYRVCGMLSDGTKSCSCYDRPGAVLKPIIYIYPEKETDITVRLGTPEKLTTSYPKYNNGWDITAYPNGDLIEKSSGNRLYSLYWEGERDASGLDLTTGFVVSGEDSASFLEEKLEMLGLNYREREEFIVYWLPKLEANKYNYIYFAKEEEINAEMPLEFSIQPDTVIRVRMIFEGLDEYKSVKEQTLEPTPERNGFTVVEWGGTELKSDN